MLRGLWKLTWLEIKIFMREPLGAFGSILFPVLLFLVVLACARRETHAWLKIATCALLVLGGALLWPAYRYAATGHALPWSQYFFEMIAPCRPA